MDIILISFLSLLNSVIGVYIWIVIASVVMSWLINFNVINVRNNFVAVVVDFLYKVTEPLLMRIRKLLPLLGGFDLSPVVLILVLWFIQSVASQFMIRIALGHG